MVYVAGRGALKPLRSLCPLCQLNDSLPYVANRGGSEPPAINLRPLRLQYPKTLTFTIRSPAKQNYIQTI